jgi:membrane-bound lytic murein transglycosylase B
MPYQSVKAVSCSILVTLLAACASVQATSRVHYDKNPHAQSFINRMVAEHDFDRGQLEQLFRHAERRDDILALISKPAEKRLQWYEYRKIFLTQSRIDGGVAFWRQNAAALRDAARQFGVDPQIIIAIIGVETRYGSNTGRHRVIDALSTLAFDYPARSPFFTSELEQYLLLGREEKMDLLATTGSYAGAMGYSQFIPSSYREYAVDFDGDGKRDLWHSPRDIIASVANYFHLHGWEHGQPVAVPAQVQSAGGDLQSIVDLGYEPRTTLGALRKDGITAQRQYPDDLPAALLRYEQENGPEYWLGFRNFYVITRYNHSPMYAMAVYQLSEEIRSAHEQDH